MAIEQQEDDDCLALSGHALQALQSFYDEQAQLQKEFTKLQTQAEEQFERISMDLFKEDWQLSQFWYSQSTADQLADFLASTESNAVCISAPTAYVALRNKLANGNTGKRCFLLEFDSRFQVFSRDFVKYDYKQPLDNMDALLNTDIDVILADPPFLSEECLEKTCMTIRNLNRDGRAKVMICTGAVMEPVLRRLMPDMQMTSFIPQHQNGLSNEFRCFANFRF